MKGRWDFFSFTPDGNFGALNHSCSEPFADMKKSPLTLSLFSSLLLTLAVPAETVFTTPAGYVTVSAEAAASAGGEQISFISHSLARELSFSGAIGATSSPNVIEVVDASFTTGQFTLNPPPEGEGQDPVPSHFVIIKTGNEAGRFFDIVDNGASAITIDANPAIDFSTLAGESVAIYRHSTIASIFGEDPTLTTDGSGVVSSSSLTTADNILLFNTESGGYETFFYLNRPASGPPLFLPAAQRWVNANDTEVDASATTIRPDDGICYVRRNTTPLSRPVFGEVLDSVIQSQTEGGLTLTTIPFPVAANLTLETSGLRPGDGETFDLASHVQGASTLSGADQILIWNGNGFDTFFYLSRPNSGPPLFIPAADRWVNANDTETDAGDTELTDGGFFIRRQSTLTPLTRAFANLTE